MPSTIKDVARIAGVSSATVSRVINNSPKISRDTREKVLECIKKLDFRINGAARSLKTNRSNTIGFFCPDIANNFFMNIAKGVDDYMKGNGYDVIVCNTGECVKEEEIRMKMLKSKQIDGMIIIPATDKGSHFVQQPLERFPVVLVDRLTEDFVTDAVLVDNVNGCYLAVEKIINSGNRRIGFIGGDMRLTPAKERYEGYIRALSDYCIPIEERVIRFGDFHAESGYILMKELMSQEFPPAHVFISNYYMHLGAVKYLVENAGKMDIKVEISSFDDMDFSSVLGFSSLRIAQPMAEMGEKAAELLLKRINGDNLVFPQIVRLKTKLVKTA